jgi:transcriptional regulator with XRE-family HTH domain
MSKENKSVFSKNMIRARKERGWSQQGAAFSIGIKRSVLASYEESRAFPSSATLILIADVYLIEDLQSFISNPNYFEPKVSAEEIFSKYLQLPWYDRRAINAILGIANNGSNY